MQEAEKRLEKLAGEFDEVFRRLKISEKLERVAELEEQVAEPEIWNDVERAKRLNQELKQVSDEVQPWELLKTQISDMRELLELGDASLKQEIESQLTAMEGEFLELKKALRFDGPYDGANAVVRITSGAGGTEAMDWAGMLERMYLRFFERKGFLVNCLERTLGEEAGIKTAVYEVSGTNAYGWLRSEHGVHRLVRLSPFNANNLRQTSFALVEVLPVLTGGEVTVDEKDLRVDTYHSGGHGGQGVNTTNSAVRITHLPTGTVVAIQNERSFHQNKEKAMEILLGKLAQMAMEQRASSIDGLRAGESAGWGQQIRNYVMQPYKLVKDTRTGVETSNVDAVLSGEIEEFIEGYLDKKTA